MGYTTEFEGDIEIVPPLNAEEIAYLNKFSSTRRMDRSKGPFFVDGSGFAGQGDDDDIANSNQPPAGQPGLWCQWVATEDGKYIAWDGGEKFYDSAEWMKYIIDELLSGCPAIPDIRPAFGAHICNGDIEANGEERGDVWRIVVADNVVTTEQGGIVYKSA